MESQFFLKTNHEIHFDLNGTTWDLRGTVSGPLVAHAIQLSGLRLDRDRVIFTGHCRG